MQAALAVDRLALADKLALSGRLRHLDGRLFDGEGRVRPGWDPEQTAAMLAEINALRQTLGFAPIDRDHNPSWEAAGLAG